MDFPYIIPCFYSGNNTAQHSWRKNSFRKISIDPHFLLGAPHRPWIPYPQASGVLSKFLSLKPTPLQGWESLPCSSRPTARGRGGLQMQTRTCRVGSTIAEYPGPAGRQPWVLLEREAAGSGGRRKLSCWQAPPLFHFPGGQADVMGWIFPDLNGSSNWSLKGDSGGSYFCHFLSFFLSC